MIISSLQRINVLIVIIRLTFFSSVYLVLLFDFVFIFNEFSTRTNLASLVIVKFR